MTPKKVAINSDTELLAAMAELAAQERQRATIERRYQERVARAQALAQEVRDKDLAKGEPRRKQLMDDIAVYAVSQRPRRRRIELPTGTLKWHRPSRPKPSLRWKVAEVIDYCKTHGLRRFVKQVETLDYEAMQRERVVAATIPGLSYPLTETLFFYAPGSEEGLRLTSRRRR